MLFTCKACNKSYSADVEAADGLCPYCRQKQPAAPASDTPAAGGSDWREPLYQRASALLGSSKPDHYARILSMLTMLSGYRDSAAKLTAFTDKLNQIAAEAESAFADPASGRDTVERHLNALRPVACAKDVSALIAKGEACLKAIQEREAQERAEQEARQARARKRRNLVIAALIAAAAAAFAFYAMVIIPGKLSDADALYAAGSYEEAAAKYDEAEFFFHADAAKAGVEKSKRAMAQQAFDAGRFADAIAIYEAIDDQKAVNSAYIAWAESSLDAGAYAEAVDCLKKGGADKARISDTYLRWSDALAAAGDAAGALEKLENVEESDARTARMAQLRMQQAKESADKVIAEGADPQYARSLGEAITTLDAQLAYCRALYDAGVDLMAVYPDGVTVTDAKLGAYLIDNPVDEDAAPDVSRALLFERREHDNSEFSSLAKRDRSDDKYYDVKLLPGHLFSSALTPAGSWEDATAIFLVDGEYLHSGDLTVQTTETRNGRTVRSYTTDYPYYTAVTAVSVYDKEHPERMWNGEVLMDEPPCAEDGWIAANRNNTYSGTKIANRQGAFDFESLYETLQVTLLLLVL